MKEAFDLIYKEIDKEEFYICMSDRLSDNDRNQLDRLHCAKEILEKIEAKLCSEN